MKQEPCKSNILTPLKTNSRVVLGLALALYGILAVFSLASGGVTWDEILDFEGVNGSFWHAINTLKGHNPDYSSITHDLEYYGNFTRWPVYILWRLFQVSPWENFQGLPRSAFLIVSGYVGLNHLSSITFGLLAALLVYKIADRLYPSARYIAPALLLTLPAWIGHSWFNSKDIPLASSYLLYTLGSIITLQLSFRGITSSPARSCVFGIREEPFAFLARSLGIAALVGSRLGMLPFVLLSDAIFLSLYLSFPAFWRILRSLIFGLACAYVATPQAWRRPIIYINDTFEHYSARSAGETTWNTFVYINSSLYETLPFLILIGLFCLAISFRKPRSFSEIAVYAPIFLQGFLVPVVLIARGTSLYNELRQIIFIYPSLVFLSSIGISRLLSGHLPPILNMSWESSRKTYFVVVAVLWFSLVLQLVAITPYHYLYRSELSRITKPQPALNRDYWGFSIRELFVNCFRDSKCTTVVERFPLLRNGYSWNPDLVDATAFLIRPYGSNQKLPDKTAKYHLKISNSIPDQTCKTLSSVNRKPIFQAAETVIYTLVKCPSSPN